MTGLPRWIRPGVIVLALTVTGAAQVIPGAGAPAGPRTGLIVGQVVDATTGAPIGEAIVTLRLPKYRDDLPTTPNDRVMADAEGRFFFSDLPAGDYFLQATQEGYAPGTYGQRRAWGDSLLLPLAEGERLADVTLRMWKYAVIAGTVVDEAGEPVVGVAVRALRRNVVAGRLQYGNLEVIPELVPAATTDDRGMFRLPQLMPGTYVVCVPSAHTTLPVAAFEDKSGTLRTDLFFAGVTESAPPGQPRTQQVGDAALLTPNRVVIPPPSSNGRMWMYPTTYYPAAKTAGAAARIAVQAGEERADLTITMQPVPAMRVSGRLVTPEGTAPPPTTIRLVGDAMSDVVTRDLAQGPDYVGFETATGMSDASGRFTILGVPPGEYVLKHADRFVSRAAQQGKPAYWISQPITVGKNDLQDLTVTVRPALRLEGRVEIQGGGSAQPLPPMLVHPGMMFETRFGEPGQFAVQADGAPPVFATVAAGGQYIVRPVESAGWFVQSVTVDGKDITDRVLDLQSDITSLVVTFTNRPSKLSGTVTDARGTASTSAIVVVFPVDRRQWSAYGASPRRLKSALTTRTGAYTFDNLPAGDYYVIAIEGDDADTWQDPERLEAFTSEATRITIRAGDAPPKLDLPLKHFR